MPRPKKTAPIENNSEKTLDNNNDGEIIASNVLEGTELSPPKSTKTKPPELDKNEYTVDPITGQKYLRPKGDNISLGQRNFRIPTINRPGYVTVWPVTRGNEIGNHIAQGWDFADPSTPHNEEAAKTPYAGTDQTMKPITHRAMQMPKEKYDKMMAARSRANTQKEQSFIYNVKSAVNPADQGEFYVSKDNRMGRDKEHGFIDNAINSSGMSSSQDVGFDKAMR